MTNHQVEWRNRHPPCFPCYLTTGSVQPGFNKGGARGAAACTSPLTLQQHPPKVRLEAGNKHGRCFQFMHFHTSPRYTTVTSISPKSPLCAGCQGSHCTAGSQPYRLNPPEPAASSPPARLPGLLGTVQAVGPPAWLPGLLGTVQAVGPPARGLHIPAPAQPVHPQSPGKHRTRSQEDRSLPTERQRERAARQ